MNFNRAFISFMLICLFQIYARAQEKAAKPSVKITGEVTKPVTLNMDDLSRMKRTTVSLKERNNKTNRYTGVAIQDILEMAGVTMGKQLHGENLAKYVLVKCADGYEVVFSLAELDTSYTDRVVILSYELEGKPLPADTGPFKLVVPGEKSLPEAAFRLQTL